MRKRDWSLGVAVALTLLTTEVIAQEMPTGTAQDLIWQETNTESGESFPSAQGSSSPRETLEVPREEELPPMGVEIEAIEVRYLDAEGNPTEGKAKPYIYQRQFDLEAGDRYNEEKARLGLAGVKRLTIVEEASVVLEPTGEERATMVINVQEGRDFRLLFALDLPHPSALFGAARPATVLANSYRPGGITGGIRLAKFNLGGNDQIVSLGLEGGERSLGFDFDFRDPRMGSSEVGYGFNVFNTRRREPVFNLGDSEVELPNGDDPWVHRIGGGVEFTRPLNQDRSFLGALGLSYQQISVRDDIFSSELFSEDEFGNTLTLSDDGSDTLLTLSFATALDKRNRPFYATEGSRLLFETHQAIPIGDAQIFFNRVSANYTQYVPLTLFRFAEGENTLVLNVQGGTMIGDEIPPYEAFNLGGSSSVRGYSTGEIGSGRSFLQGTAEYRFPIAVISIAENDIPLGGGLFFDYATDLGTGDAIEGEPAEERDKPGDGFGYGVGLRAKTSFGAVRLEFALNDEGGSALIFNIGDRF